MTMKQEEKHLFLRTGRDEKKKNKTGSHEVKFADRSWWWQEVSRVIMYHLYVESKKVKPIENSKMVVTRD